MLRPTNRTEQLSYVFIFSHLYTSEFLCYTILSIIYTVLLGRDRFHCRGAVFSFIIFQPSEYSSISYAVYFADCLVRHCLSHLPHICNICSNDLIVFWIKSFPNIKSLFYRYVLKYRDTKYIPVLIHFFYPLA